jgi:DUF1680 family protein
VGSGVTLQMVTSLPWDGSVKIKITTKKAEQFALILRKPAWAENYRILINGEEVIPKIKSMSVKGMAASGLDFSTSAWLSIDKVFTSGDRIDLTLDLPIKLLFQDKRIAKCGGKAAISRGQILYCLESINNSADLEKSILEPGTLNLIKDDESSGGIPILCGKTTYGQDLTFTPYYLWGNCGDTAMTVFIQCQV